MKEDKMSFKEFLNKPMTERETQIWFLGVSLAFVMGAIIGYNLK